MARDEHLMHSPTTRPASLRVYGWTPATLSLGCFQRFAEIDSLPEKMRAWPVVRRLTGGGAILHDREVTYCLCVDDSIEFAKQAPAALYELVHRLWRDAIACGGPQSSLAPDHLPFPSPRRGPFFCFAEPGRTDLVVDGGKVLGSAQRRIPGRVMQHGSLLLGRSDASMPGADLGDPPASSVNNWIDRFVASLADALRLTAQASDWSDASLVDIETRRVRYAGAAWTQRH